MEQLWKSFSMPMKCRLRKTAENDIEDFDTHLKAIFSEFLYSLEITENTTERVRAEFQSRLESKDLTISDLQERIRQAEQATAVECEMSAMSEQTSIQLASLNFELDNVRKALATAQDLKWLKMMLQNGLNWRT